LHHPGPDDPDVEESGSTLLENALLKARAGFTRSGIPTLADDTGLEVDALDGAPGIYSSRYAGEHATYEENRRKLIDVIRQFPEVARAARFRSTIVYVDGVRELHFEGEVEGLILTEERGTNGFGYDPIFLPKGETRTMAEMTNREKNAISHRGRALRAFLQWWTSEDTG
jgi:XTP/dITP diphosphohydrolase